MRNINTKDFHRKINLAAGFLKALAHRDRLAILCQLVDSEKSVSSLHKSSRLSLSAFSQHLAVLRAKRLVANRKQSQMVFYKLANSKIKAILYLLHKLYCK